LVGHGHDGNDEWGLRFQHSVRKLFQGTSCSCLNCAVPVPFILSENPNTNPYTNTDLCFPFTSLCSEKLRDGNVIVVWVGVGVGAWEVWGTVYNLEAGGGSGREMGAVQRQDNVLQ
jgi:hypothetical protein